MCAHMCVPLCLCLCVHMCRGGAIKGKWGGGVGGYYYEWLLSDS